MTSINTKYAIQIDIKAEMVDVVVEKFRRLYSDLEQVNYVQEVF